MKNAEQQKTEDANLKNALSAVRVTPCRNREDADVDANQNHSVKEGNIMCMDHSIICSCGRNEASFNFKNDIMPPETINRLYCPECSQKEDFDPLNMLKDNGWMIHFEMEVAGLYSSRLPANEKAKLSPDLLFDEGYVTWRGIYPGDHIDSVKEREELAKLAKTDPAKYFNEMKGWATNRMARLRDVGWRKAYEG